MIYYLSPRYAYHAPKKGQLCYFYVKNAQLCCFMLSKQPNIYAEIIGSIMDISLSAALIFNITFEFKKFVSRKRGCNSQEVNERYTWFFLLVESVLPETRPFKGTPLPYLAQRVAGMYSTSPMRRLPFKA